jgi:hypothetical protein
VFRHLLLTSGTGTLFSPIDYPPDYFSAFACSQVWLPTVQEVLHADWQDVWHSPHPPFLTVFCRFLVFNVFICFIKVVLLFAVLMHLPIHARLLYHTGRRFKRIRRIFFIFSGIHGLPSETKRFSSPWDICASPPLRFRIR